MSNPPNGSGFFSGSVVLPEVNSTDALVADLTATVAEVTASATAAQASSVTASTAARNALISETNVANLAQQATTTVNAATSAAAQAQAAISAANTTLTTAQAAATTATTQAGNAATSASAAAASQASATASQTAATASQSAAAGSASTASTAATTATNQATAAGQSATNAAASASAASTSASSAASSQSAASTSAANAAASATGAGNSSVAAANSATNASTSATTATNQAAAAAASAALAAQNAAAVALPIPVTSGGTGGTTLATARSNLGIAQLSGRNRIINGQGAISQRAQVTNSTTTGTSNIIYGGPDRWRMVNNGGGGGFAQNQGTMVYNGVTYPCVVQTVITAAADLSGTNTWFGLNQTIEGFNCFDLVGQPVVVSFLFRASVAGSYSVCFRDGGGAAAYVSQFTVAANTPTYVVVPIPAVPLTASMPMTTAVGAVLSIGAMNSGAYIAPSTNTWLSGNYQRASGTVAWTQTVGATIAVTNVQLEVGTQPTPYEWESVATTLLKCQRYYETGQYYFYGYANQSNFAMLGLVTMQVNKRGQPSYTSQYQSGSGVVTSLTFNPLNTSEFALYTTSTAVGPASWTAAWQANSEI